MRRTAWFFLILFLIANTFFYFPMTSRVSADDSTTTSSASDPITQICATTTDSADKALCATYAQLVQEMAADQTSLDQQKGQSATLSGAISLLQTQIDQAKDNIQAKTIAITQLSGQIQSKDSTIQTLNQQVQASDASLAEMIRNIREIDDTSIITVILSSESVSDLFQDIDTYNSIQRALASTLNQINGTKTETAQEETQLETQQNQEIDAKALLEDAQEQVQDRESQQQSLLSISNNKAEEYQKVLSEQQTQADAIRSKLFALRDTTSISFGDALNYANEVSAVTGVQPAFLLAILTQESNLGNNVGTCYLTNDVTGSGINILSGAAVSRVMSVSRDVTPFLAITKALGRDPNKTPVSCPIAGIPGYGGAMGPSQFIASTWTLIESKVSAALGGIAPDPWAPEDAFMASGIYLSALGASGDSYTSERTAACRYYGGGSSCTSITAPYGNSVMALDKTIQTTMIDPLQGL